MMRDPEPGSRIMFHDFCQSVTLVFCQRTHVSHDHHPRGPCCSRARISYDEPCMGAIFYQKIFASALTLVLSNGLCNVLKRNVYWFPRGLMSTSLTLVSFFSTGKRSCSGDSITSISPPRSALMAVWWSAMARHSTRSTLATLPPARPDGASGRALYWANFTYTALSPGFHSSGLKTKGPEPVKSLICSFGDVSATRLGIMKGTFEL